MTSGFAVVPGLQGICLPICIHYALMLPTVSTSVSASWLWGCCSAPLLCVCVCTWAHMCGSQKLVSGVSIDLSLPCLWDKLFHWAWGFPIILNGQQDPRIFLCLSQCWDYRHGSCVLGLELSQVLMLAQWALYQPSRIPSFSASCFQMGLFQQKPKLPPIALQFRCSPAPSCSLCSSVKSLLPTITGTCIILFVGPREAKLRYVYTHAFPLFSIRKQ